MIIFPFKNVKCLLFAPLKPFKTFCFDSIPDLQKSYKNSAKNCHVLFTQIPHTLIFYFICLFIHTHYFSEQFESGWHDSSLSPTISELYLSYSYI